MESQQSRRGMGLYPRRISLVMEASNCARRVRMETAIFKTARCLTTAPPACFTCVPYPRPGNSMAASDETSERGGCGRYPYGPQTLLAHFPGFTSSAVPMSLSTRLSHCTPPSAVPRFAWRPLPSITSRQHHGHSVRPRPSTESANLHHQGAYGAFCLALGRRRIRMDVPCRPNPVRALCD
ncbi:hypothetical protein BCR34DRAFT_256230 [Clohesyomyces aquaticus]|uniref:Uncharacterized protein n=1 Tax=Clohesyomyces aquaticus TaxID=1231657 RepID=A0A1Y1ZU05_9PLEO|nr:hypothetical protein BCR34DRAFT_256230 [Clohesyomyces aquaticus]